MNNECKAQSNPSAEQQKVNTQPQDNKSTKKPRKQTSRKVAPKTVKQVKPVVVSKNYNIELSALEDLIDIGDTRTIFFKPDRNMIVFRFPAVASTSPLPSILPEVYTFTYCVNEHRIDGQMLPFLDVHRCYFKFGKLVSHYEFSIEHELVLGCFNQSTVRDYNVLINSIFMTVNRGCANTKRLSFDVNAKLDAIAALYMIRNPGFDSVTSSVIRTISSYVPTVDGYYVLGDHTKLIEANVPHKYTWHEDLKPVVQEYIARLLDDDYHDIIFPLNAPARTQEAFEEGFTKRLTSPPRVSHMFNGVNYTRVTANRTLEEVVDHVFHNYLEERMKAIEPLTYEEILTRCEKHARERFVDMKSIKAYVEGARIALYEDVRSQKFINCCKGAIELGTFDKKEFYKEPKPIRFIMAPDCRVRGFCHALLMNPQLRLFGEGQTLNPHCVKHMSEEARKQYIRQLFGNCQVFSTDYSSMESSVSADMMSIIEEKIFSLLATGTNLDQKIHTLWQYYISGNKNGKYHITGKTFDMEIQPMRLSGQDHTSAGNWLINFTWCIYFVRIITGHYPDPKKFKLVCEGDDGLGSMEIVLDNNETYTVNPEDFDAAAETVGAKLKIFGYPTLDDASFCGIKLFPAYSKHIKEPRDELCVDTYYILAKVLYDMSYDRTTRKHDSPKIYARVLSYLPRAVGNDELYEALLYLGQKHMPSDSTVRTSWFKRLCIEVFYKGEDFSFSDFIKHWRLEEFCKRMNLPYFRVLRTPDVLSYPGPQHGNMQVVHIDKTKIASWTNEIRLIYDSMYCMPEIFSSDYEIVLNPSSGMCSIDSTYEFYKRTDQFADDSMTLEMYRNCIRQVMLTTDGGLTLSQVKNTVPVGGYLNYYTKEEGYLRITKKVDPTSGAIELVEEPIDKPDLVVASYTRGTTGHTVLYSKKSEVQVKYKGVFGDGAFGMLCFTSIVFLIGFIMVSFSIARSSITLCKFENGNDFTVSNLSIISFIAGVLKFLSAWYGDKAKPARALVLVPVGLVIYQYFFTILIAVSLIAIGSGTLAFAGVSLRDVLYGIARLIAISIVGLTNLVMGVGDKFGVQHKERLVGVFWLVIIVLIIELFVLMF